MKIIIQLVILTLSLLLINAYDGFNQYTTNPRPFTRLIKSCCDLRAFSPMRVPTGVYKMSIGRFASANVYCDMATDGGGWLVVQRNKNNSRLSFDKNWREYEEGFGDPGSDLWAGLKLMHTLTQSGQWEMRVDYQKNDNTWSYLHYNQFSVGSASEEYLLTVGGYSGSIPSNNALYYNGMKFSTPDNDNDEHNSTNCGADRKSGYWYKNCQYINLNQQPPYVYPHGSIIFDGMKIRPKDCLIQ